ncbi:MAG: TonB family protein [Spartobacteria bacterium]
MNKLRVLFFFGLLALVIGIARCNSRSNSHAQSPIFPSASPAIAIAAATPVSTPTPAPSASATPVLAAQPFDFQKVTGRVTPAVALISLFDQSGKLIRTAGGCFISEDGRIVTSSAAAKDAANAVAKSSDGRIYNVAGVIAEAAPLGIAVLKAETKKPVAFIAPNKVALPDTGAKLAVVSSPIARRKPPQIETTVTARRSDGSGDWVEVAPPIPNDLLGSPVIDEKGEFVGVVASGLAPGTPNIVRGSTGVESIVARIDPRAPVAWAAAHVTPTPPAEGPKPQMRLAKIPLVTADRPGNSKLVYSPKPAYPLAARNARFVLKGSGRYKVTFAANGQVKNVEVLESARSSELDSAATQTLRKWKAAPGQEWSATVPIAFEP